MNSRTQAALAGLAQVGTPRAQPITSHSDPPAPTRARAVLQSVSRLHITHRGQVKLGLGLMVIAVGFLALL